MRPELEFIARIEEYLNHTMSSEDRKVFEQRLATDKKLQQEVQLQRELMEGIQSHGLRQHIRLAKKNYLFRKKAIKLGIIGVVIVAASAIAGFFILSTDTPSEEELPIQQEEQLDSAIPSAIQLDTQVFTIPSDADQVLETKEGIVFVIPEDGFQRADNQTVSKNIQIEVKEALSPASIIKAGLSTTSNGELLETAGMFEFRAYDEGVELQLKAGKEVLVDLPSNRPATNMQLFDGEADSTGNINWVNPKPIENFLTTVDINTLNFYPRDFLDSLGMLGYDINNKSLTDSVFYSYFCGMESSSSSTVEEVALLSEVGRNFYTDTIPASNYYSETFAQDEAAEDVSESYDREMNCGIEPSDVRAIWNKKFQDTFIATKAFEERITYMYETCSGNALDIYLNHLDEPLYISDSLAALKFDTEVRAAKGYRHDTFWKFYLRKDGRVRLNDRLAKKLAEHYNQKRSIFLKATEAANKEFWKAQRELDEANNQQRNEFWSNETGRNALNWQAEFELNLTEAYKQLGYDRPRFNIQPNQSFSFPIRSTGWKNVDQFVSASTTNRRTLDFEDKDGNKAVIKYEPLSVKLSEVEDADRTHVYLLGDKQFSFRRVNATNGFYLEQLNELMKYHFLAVAYKGDQCFVSFQENIAAGVYEFALKEMPEKELTKLINSLSGQRAQQDLTADLAFKKTMAIDAVRRAKNRKLRQEQIAIYQTIFPCEKPRLARRKPANTQQSGAMIDSRRSTN